MPLSPLLDPDRIALLAGPVDRDRVLDEAARLLAGDSPADAASIADCLRQRERLGSTAIGHGVAIPHGRCSVYGEARAAFLRLASPVDFDAGDGEPVDLVFAMAVPEHFTQQHLQLLSELAERFAGAEGASRRLEAVDTVARRPSLAGYLNAIYPNKVQILGTEELAWLDGLDSRQRWETIHKIVHYSPLALVVSKDQSCPEDLRIAAEETGTPLWSSPKRGHELLNHLQYHLARTLAPRVTLHGVFMEIYSIGVLITGDSGSGKSELALELVTRGHRLVADDAPEFTQIAPDVLDGTCPELLQDLLEVRGLGVLNIRDMFGDTAVKRNKYLRLIVHLTKPGAEPAPAPGGMERLTGDGGARRVLDLDVPTITVPVMAGRNLAVLTEAAARVHILRAKGVDPAAAFMARHSHFLERAS